MTPTPPTNGARRFDSDLWPGTAPRATETRVDQTRVDQLRLAQPGSGQPGSGQPGSAQPGSGRTGSGRPGAAQNAPGPQARPAQPPVAQLKIDWIRCDGRGLCSEILPELLALDPWGYPVARSGAGLGTKLIAIPAAMEAHADLAIASCPKLAIIKLPEGGR